MRFQHLARPLVFALCLSLLFGLFVLGGAGWPAEPSPGLDPAEPDITPADHPGERVETSGIVVETDPVVIEIEGDTGTERLELENAPGDAELGEQLTVSGELTEDGRLVVDAERAVVREPWELTYMYVISLVGALFVVGRAIDGWRFEPRTLTFHPRKTPLHERFRTDGGNRANG